MTKSCEKDCAFVDASKLMVKVAIKHHVAKSEDHETKVLALCDTEAESCVIAFPGGSEELMKVRAYIKSIIPSDGQE